MNLLLSSWVLNEKQRMLFSVKNQMKKMFIFIFGQQLSIILYTTKVAKPQNFFSFLSHFKKIHEITAVAYFMGKVHGQ